LSIFPAAAAADLGAGGFLEVTVPSDENAPFSNSIHQ